MKAESKIYLWLFIVTFVLIIALLNPHFVKIESKGYEITENPVFKKFDFGIINIEAYEEQCKNLYHYNPNKYELKCTEGNEEGKWLSDECGNRLSTIYIYSGKGTCVFTYYEYKYQLLWGID